MTTDPGNYIKGIGRDRSPVFLNPVTAKDRLKPFEDGKDAYKYKYLEEYKDVPELEYEIIRKLKTK